MNDEKPGHTLSSSLHSQGSLMIQSSSKYSGLPSKKAHQSNKFSSITQDPLYKFPMLQTNDHTRFLSRSDFTCAESIDLRKSIAQLQDRSPFRQEENSIESCKLELSNRTQQILQRLQFDNRGDESHYTIESKLSLSLNGEDVICQDSMSDIDWEGKQSLNSQEEADVSRNLDNPMAELIIETQESLSLFKSLDAIDHFEQQESAALTLSNRQFLQGNTASKAKLCNMNKSEVIQALTSSPLLRKIVMCTESQNSQIIESTQSKLELRPVQIVYSFAACGFSSSPVIEYSNKDKGSCGTIPYTETDHVLVTLMPISILKEISAYSVQWISCGYEHISAITNQGKVLSWGFGASGCLGHGDRETYTRPSFVLALIDVDVVYLECGGYHSVALSGAGEVWAWGRGDVHQLGLPLASLENDGTGRVSLTPQKLPLSNIKSIACGEAHTLALNSNGQMLAFGWAEEGQLGLPESMLVNKLCTEKIQTVRIPHKIIKVAAGAVFSACLTETGKVFAWGSGQQGQLGMGTVLRSSQYPVLVGSLGNETIIEIVCGENHVICLSDSGKMFGWGKGSVGDFDNPKDYPYGSEIVCFVPRMLSHVDIVHRFISKGSIDDASSS